MAADKKVHDEKLEISSITDYLYLSGCDMVTGDRLNSLGIRCAINCIKGVKHKLPSHIDYLYCPIEDVEWQSLQPHLDQVVDLIEKHRSINEKTLVYCGLGISRYIKYHITALITKVISTQYHRSAAMVIAYLMKYQRMSLINAYKFVQLRRRIVCPNVGFFRQLCDYEYRLFGERTVKIIEAVPGIFVANVVWDEIYDEVTNKMATIAI